MIRLYIMISCHVNRKRWLETLCMIILRLKHVLQVLVVCTNTDENCHLRTEDRWLTIKCQDCAQNDDTAAEECRKKAESGNKLTAPGTLATAYV